jgi:PRTRC genetic system protein E
MRPFWIGLQVFTQWKEIMFTELKPLIESRPLTITMASLADGRIRVNVIPQALPKDAEANSKIKYSHKDEVTEVPESALKALTTPLSLTGTPEEIDAALPQALLQYSEAHLHLQQTLDQAKTQISEAVKAIDEREKAKAKAKSSTGKASEKHANGQEKQKPEDVGLLPLWCTPPQGKQGTQTTESEVPVTEAAQIALPESAAEEVARSCQQT